MSNTKDIKVTIIIPAYNVENYIAKGIESCINQTYNNIEIIIIDDGSTDKTWRVIQEYSAKDCRIICTRQDNQGVSVARNTALDMASGDYIVFLDSDDWLEEETIEKLLKNVLEEDSLVCSDCNFVYIEKDGNYTSECQMGDYKDEICSSENVLNFVGMKSKFRLVSSCYKLFNRRVIEENHLRFQRGIHQGEDGLFTFKYLCNVKKVKYICYPLWNILDRPGSACNVQYNPKWKTALDAVDGMLSYKENLMPETIDAIYAFKAERAMWLETSCIRSDNFVYDDYVFYKKLLKENGKYLIKRENKIKTRIQCFLYTTIPLKVLKLCLEVKERLSEI